MSEGTSRRAVLAGAAAAGVAQAVLPDQLKLIAPAEARPADQPVTDKVRWGILIDTTKCDGCSECVTACNEEHGLDDGLAAEIGTQYIRIVNMTNPETGAERSLPFMCQHCESPPCADVCPTGASFKRADGIVLVDRHICIGCRYCMMACPFKARSFVHAPLDGQKPHNPRGLGCVESCNMCVHRVDNGENPACVDACNAKGKGGMVFGDLKDPDSDIAKTLKAHGSTKVRADLKLNQGVTYRGLDL